MWQTDESAKQNGVLHGTEITIAIPFCIVSEKDRTVA